ncbi:hypothetical protein FHS38_005579 [Streptomyces netropsis]|uniref:Uncharacterized protein n=1 Tax=Streptomyces netropsis TaxID=55404 RepID=A0A7W7PGY0_STRNE|nr:hypothetical protein [Streptomyces netropsis]
MATRSGARPVLVAAPLQVGTLTPWASPHRRYPLPPTAPAGTPTALRTRWSR